MYKTILVPTDGTALSDTAVEAAIKYAQSSPDSKIIGLSVVEPIHAANSDGSYFIDMTSYVEGSKKHAQEYVDKISSAAQAAGVQCETAVIAESDKPAEEILKAAGEYGADCIYMGSHGASGLKAMILGSNTQKVASQASVPVKIIRDIN